ncbi:MAG: hypothetical protein AAF600_04525 [Bacteroidota bacterium]
MVLTISLPILPPNTCVLRPQVKKLTIELIDNLGIYNLNDIVEFAPGLGFTASLALKNNPKSYTGIELNEEAAGN